MIIDEDILLKIRNFAALGHTPRQIASLLKVPPRETEMFLYEFTDPDTKVNEYYLMGRNMGYCNQNVELMKAAEKGDTFAIDTLDRRKHDQELADMRQELFGIL